jgi:hypothetical protein
VFFTDPTPASLADALDRVTSTAFDVSRIRAWSERFSHERHTASLTAAIAETLARPAGTRW